jgi:hypothetical protein
MATQVHVTTAITWSEVLNTVDYFAEFLLDTEEVCEADARRLEKAAAQVRELLEKQKGTKG